MKAVIQRVTSASVVINKGDERRIGEGLVVLLGVHETDTEADVKWLSRKILNLRIFKDKDEKMNLSILDTQGNILLISQFTLHAKYKKGNRPSFIEAAKPEQAIPLYEQFKLEVRRQIKGVLCSGEFGAQMDVHLINDGPVTIVMDSLQRE